MPDSPSFASQPLDTDVYDVRSLLPAGQSTLGVHIPKTQDCVAVSAAVLQSPQS